MITVNLDLFTYLMEITDKDVEIVETRCVNFEWTDDFTSNYSSIRVIRDSS